MIAAAEAGGRVLLEYFGQDLTVEEKTMASDFRTKADTESEEAIVRILSKYFPGHNIFAEERGLIDKQSDWEFVVDPLDGSNNYMLGIPYYSVSIALVKGDEIKYAVIHDPTLQRTYHAAKNKGAYVNGKKLKVSQTKDIKRVTFGYSHNYDGPRDYHTDLVKKLHRKNIKRSVVNWSPCLDFCLLAEGKIEAFFNNGNEIFDFLSGKLMTREAGAIIKEFADGQVEGDRNDKFLASNCSEIEQEILECL